MAKFDISQHIKVEALGTRVVDVLSPTQFEVNGKVYDSTDYTLTQVPTEDDPTVLLPVDQMNYPYMVQLNPATLNIYWSRIQGASYRYYNGTSSTPGSYSTITGSSVQITTISPTDTTWFKLQINTGSGWVDFVAMPDGSTYRYKRDLDNTYPVGYYYPDTSSDNTVGYLLGPTSYPQGISGVDSYDSTRFVVGFVSPLVFTDVDYFTIGISNYLTYYPQFKVEPRHIGEIEAPYEVLLNKSIFDLNSTKVVVTAVKTNATTEVILTHITPAQPLAGLTINPTVLPKVVDGPSAYEPFNYSLDITSITYDGQVIPSGEWSQYMSTSVTAEGYVSLYFPENLDPEVVFNFGVGPGSYRILNNVAGTTYNWPIGQDAHDEYAALGTHRFTVQTLSPGSFPTPSIAYDVNLTVSRNPSYVYPGRYGENFTQEIVNSTTRIFRWMGTGDFYLGQTESSKYPLYKVTGPSGTSWDGQNYTGVQVTNLPTNFIINVIDFDGNYMASYSEGNPYRDSNVLYFAYGWWPIQCSVANVDINMGFDEEKAMLRRPEVGTCSLTMKGDEADPRVNTALQLDSKIRVLLAAEASPDGSEDYLFAGFIDGLSTNYDTFGNAITTLGAVDAMSRVLNVTIPTYEFANAESFGQRMFNVFENYIAPATWGVSYDDSLYSTYAAYDRSVFPPESRDNVSSSEVINELTEGEFGIMAQNRGGVIFWLNRSVPAIVYAASESLVNQPNWYGFSTEHDPQSLDHFCISDFTISNRMEDITNKVTATLTYDELTSYTYTDSASVTRYGTRAYDVQLNLHAPAGNPTQYLQRWGEEVPYSEDRSELESIRTNVVNRDGYVTRAYQTDVLADAVRVYIKTGPVDVNGIWFARRIRHSITPDNWTMDLELSSN